VETEAAMADDRLRAYVSLWSADPLALGDVVDLVADRADGLHLDVFDGQVVEDLLFGPHTVAALRARTAALIDVHLFAADPDAWARRFVEVGADMVTVQVRDCPDARATVRLIRGLGARVGIGLQADDPVEAVLPHLDAVDRVLVMGTRVGVKGVALLAQTPERVGLVASACARLARPPEVVVDGGIRRRTVPVLAAAGADGVVPGSLVFGEADPVAALAWIHAHRPARPSGGALEGAAGRADQRPKRA
jgi:ribulose-phosphate 3-epimerase